MWGLGFLGLGAVSVLEEMFKNRGACRSRIERIIWLEIEKICSLTKRDLFFFLILVMGSGKEWIFLLYIFFL